MTGLFITLEGIDGCGKTTLQQLLAEKLRALGYPVLTTREPGGSRAGRRIRELLLDSAYGTVDGRSEALLYAADRALHAADVIRPALARGEIVLCDRYIDSSLAYQGGGRGLALAELAQINRFAVNGLTPDITFLLDLPAEAALARLRGKRDRMEQEDIAFFQRTAAAYHALAAAEPGRFVYVDATQTVEQELAAMLAGLQPFLARGEG